MRQSDLALPGAADLRRSSCACSRSRPASRPTATTSARSASSRRSTASSRAATSRKARRSVVGTMNNAGTVLLHLADMSVIEAEVEVDETDIPAVQLGQTAKITSTRSTARPSPARSPRSATARFRRRAAAAGTQATNFKVTVHVRCGDSGGPARASPARPRSRRPRARTSRPCRSRRPTVREVVVDDKGEIVREPVTTEGTRRPTTRRRSRPPS